MCKPLECRPTSESRCVSEFAAFGWTRELPDPRAEETFHRSKLRHWLKLRSK
jgi:hypothetical protein